MTCEVDGLGLGVQVHDEGDDGGGQVPPHIVRDVALAIVAIDLGDAIHVRFVVFNVVITNSHASV